MKKNQQRTKKACKTTQYHFLILSKQQCSHHCILYIISQQKGEHQPYYHQNCVGKKSILCKTEVFNHDKRILANIVSEKLPRMCYNKVFGIHKIHQLVKPIYIITYDEIYSKTCLKWPLKKNTKIGFQGGLSLNVGQKYCRMLQWEHSAILSTFIKVPFVINILVLSIFEWPLKTGFTVLILSMLACHLLIPFANLS